MFLISVCWYLFVYIFPISHFRYLGTEFQNNTDKRCEYCPWCDDRVLSMVWFRCSWLSKAWKFNKHIPPLGLRTTLTPIWLGRLWDWTSCISHRKNLLGKKHLWAIMDLGICVTKHTFNYLRCPGSKETERIEPTRRRSARSTRENINLLGTLRSR